MDYVLKDSSKYLLSSNLYQINTNYVLDVIDLSNFYNAEVT